jgi:hypothetical protein
MPGFHAMWLGLGAAMIFPFALLGAALRPLWVPLAFAIGGALIWLYGLGVWGFLAGAVGGVVGVLLGVPLRAAVLGFRNRRIAARTPTTSGGST